MTRRLWVGVFFVPFLGLVLSGCTNNGGSPTTRGTCTPVPEAEGLGWDVTASALSGEGRELALQRRVVIVGDDGESTMAETTIAADGERVMQMGPSRREPMLYAPANPLRGQVLRRRWVHELCCPTDRVCGNICCAEGSGCDLQTRSCKACPLLNYKFCSVSGSCCPNTEVCTSVFGLCCPAGQMYCGSPPACRPAAECVE